MQHDTTNPMHGTFLREVDRLIATSDFDIEAVAKIAGLPLAALTGAHGGVIRVPVQKIRSLADITGADHRALTRIWCAEYAPWVIELLDELCGSKPAHPVAEDRS